MTVIQISLCLGELLAIESTAIKVAHNSFICCRYCHETIAHLLICSNITKPLTLQAPRISCCCPHHSHPYLAITLIVFQVLRQVGGCLLMSLLLLVVEGSTSILYSLAAALEVQSQQSHND